MAKAPAPAAWRRPKTLIARFMLSAILLLFLFQLLAHERIPCPDIIQPAFAGALLPPVKDLPTDTCQVEYDRLTAGRLPLSHHELRRSRSNWGNTARLQRLVQKLSRREPTTGVVFGGSITVGHGSKIKYSDLLEEWMNEKYKVERGKKHVVLNKGSHGADVSKPWSLGNLSVETITYHTYIY